MFQLLASLFILWLKPLPTGVDFHDIQKLLQSDHVLLISIKQSHQSFDVVFKGKGVTFDVDNSIVFCHQEKESTRCRLMDTRFVDSVEGFLPGDSL